MPDGTPKDFETVEAARAYRAKNFPVAAEEPRETPRFPGLEEKIAGILSGGAKDAAEMEGMAKSVGRGVEGGARAVARGVSGRLSSQGMDVGNYLLNKLTGKGKKLEDVRGERREYEKGLAEDIPGGEMTTAGLELAAGLTPWGVPAKLFGLTSKIPLLKKAAERVPGLIGKVAKKVPDINKALESRGFFNTIFKAAPSAAVRGAVTGGALTLADPDMEGGSGTGMGAAIDPALMMAGRSGAAVGRVAKRVPGLIGKFMKRLPEMIPMVGDEIKSDRLAKFSSGVEEIAGGPKAREVAGREVAGGFGKTKQQASEEYENFMEPFRSKFNNEKVSLERLRKGYVEKLREEGLIDPKGNLLDDSMELLFEPDARPTFKKLTQQLMAINKNTTFAELEDITQRIGKLAKFNKGSRPEKDKVFGGLFREARETLLDAVEDLAGPQSKEAVRQARQKISKNIKVFEGAGGRGGEIGDLLELRPEEIVEKAASRGSLDLPSVVNEALEANLENLQPIKQAVIANIKLNASDPKKLQKALATYKDVLPKLLNPEEMDELLKLAGTYKKPPGVVSKAGGAIAGQVERGFLPRLLGIKATEDLSNER